MAFRKTVGKTLIKGAVAVAAVNIAVCTAISHKKKKAVKSEEKNEGNFCKHFEVFMQGRQIKLAEEELKKLKIKTFMGGVDLDLREAIINEDMQIKCKSVMGGINIRVPEGVNVIVQGKSIMGGITNFVPVQQGDDIPTIYVEANQVMGGICIKAGPSDEIISEDTDNEAAESDSVENKVAEEI